MKTFGLVLALVMVVAGGAVAQTETATYDVYAGWNMVSAPLVPLNPVPSNPSWMGGADDGVFDPLDIDLSGSLSRWEAPSQGTALWSIFSPDEFGNVLLGDGYWMYQPSGGTVSYTGVADGVPDASSNMTDMWISLPGNQSDGADAGGWHIIGTPFNHSICFSKIPMNLLGDNILVTDGTQVLTWGEAATAGWVDDPMQGWDGASQGVQTAGYFFADTEYLDPGKGFWCHTNKDNLALIVPAY